MDNKEIKEAFERFRVWLTEREFNPDDCYKFMFMGKDKQGDFYMFKNINTRNYIRVNIRQTTFNQ